MNIFTNLFILSCLFLFSACSNKRRMVDYCAYEQPNETQLVSIARGVLMKLPNSEKLFYGNYGGLGSDGGLPIDAMDELFRRHDVVYTEASTLKVIRVSDEMLVKYLQGIPDHSLDKDGQAYRDLAIRFFQKPISKIVSKPCPAFFKCAEPPDSPFPNAESVIYFFCPSHPGFPSRRT